ncbi:aminotransferase class I/II-fold pyridoxal phosphate-dependent enzyme [Caloramator quimbayensis]|uniref:aminotransferase class I/II-fold pyridoxal phosphate-dependent enzyme n=1 Tax=Caloramator quimbayensis TaxID=1147123 RepID=UPI000999870F|nr:aminotransferase class I/II-fold pyridoxal phosphate-dependent enzyme [Caloramator quimbayensis]
MITLHDFRSERVLKLKDNPTFKNLFDIICENGDLAAAEYMEDDSIKTFTYRYYKNAVYNAAYKLQQMIKVEKGSFVGLMLDNCPEWPVVFWAVLMAGFKPLLIDFRATSELLRHLVNETGAAAVITDDFSRIGFDILKIDYRDLICESDEFINFNADWADEIALCTSGTTATSKIYVYDGYNICGQLLNGEALKNKSPLLMPEGEAKVLAFLPFHHVFGIIGVYLWYSFYGKTVVYLKNRAQSTIITACRRHRVTHILGVPALYNNLSMGIMKRFSQSSEKEKEFIEKMINLSLELQRSLGEQGRQIVFKKLFYDIHKEFLGNDIVALVTGGGHIPIETLRVLNALGFYLVSGYGMTEIGIASVYTGFDIDKRLKANLGEAFPSLSFKVTASDGAGELFVKGECIHKGRIKDKKFYPAETYDGYFATGDIAIIKDGELFIHGRIKDVIINDSGENVYPDEIEDYFGNIEGVKEICALGLKNERESEDISLVVYSEEKGNDYREYIGGLVYKINESLPIYKRIKKLLLSENPLPSVNGKIQRQKLKKLIEDRSFVCSAVEIKKSEDEKNKEQDKNILINLSSIKEQIRLYFSDVLGIASDSIADNAHFVNDLGGDSLQSIELRLKIEEKYDILLSDAEYYKCTNIEELSNLILKHISGEAAAAKDASAKKVKRKAVKTFEDSIEYKDFEKRRRLLESTENPYFICHDSIIRDTSIVKDREVINFGSYNYVGMSGHPQTVKAAKEAAEKYGTSASGSRLISGEKNLYIELEREIAKWKHAEDCLVLVSGHATNVTFVGNFCGENDLILYDALSHNSIEQGCRISRAAAKAFPHNDIDALERILRQNRDYYEKILVVVEGVYSMDGDIAPIPEFIKLKEKYGFFLMVDEAHSSCVIGEHGGGVDEYFKLKGDEIDIKMGTLSKGLGTCGGYLAGKKSLIEYLRYNLPGFVFSVGINPPSAAATLAAVRLIQRDNSMVKKLHENIKIFIEEAHLRNLNTCLAKETAIIPILVGKDRDAFILSNLLLKNGVFVPPAVYPAVPKGYARLRFCVNCNHNRDQIVYALDTLKNIAEKEGIKLPCMDGGKYSER